MVWIVVKLIMVFNIFQWNARSLIANGQEFKKVIKDSNEKPDIICIQESWLRPHLKFGLVGYNSIRRDRENNQGGGCITLIKDNLAYRRIKYSGEYECIVVEVYVRN